MAYSRYEQETSIVWDEDEKIARIYTASPVTIRKLDKLVAEHPEAYKKLWEQVDGLAKKYEVAKRYIRFGKPVERTEEQIEAARERYRLNAEKIHAARKNSG